MINDEILAIRDDIVKTIGDDCERIYLFGSYAYGTPRIGGNKPSDYDFYVVLRDGSEHPILAEQKIHRTLAYTPITLDVDVLANYKSHFEERSEYLPLEKKIAKEGVLLYESN
jgi:predicted nucleotidyltransferase